MAKMSFLAAAIGACLVSGVALAQPAHPLRTRGVITSVSGNELDVTSRSGAKVVYVLTDKTRIAGMTIAKLSDIKPGSFIGSAAIPLPDGKLKALEVHVFPPSLRGMGEGHRPWDQGKGSSMTNGTVGKLVVANGDTMTVTYHGGQKIIVVPPDVPIVSIVPGDRALLTVGAHVSASGAKDTDGSIHALNVSVGLNGLVPPT
ncbi:MULTISPECIES: DUF5666 domain-containing protein [unclassified Acidisoma]|jgi:hypothetical protein|uniref:DUF5666 domain-containing protein n=1 Tax=unclassified Acidisoma TaxID=2634065 RepID=UPI00131ACC04|nr:MULTISPECIES: DUF5666 domain-containing protein [unclassified Acidisoma]